MTKVKEYNLVQLVYGILFCHLFICMVSSSVVSRLEPGVVVFWGKVVILLRFSLLAVTLLQFVLNNITVKDFFVYGIFLIVTFISYLSVETWMLFDVLFVAVFWRKYIDDTKVLRLYLTLIGVMFFFIALLFLAGAFQGDVTFARASGRIRYTLGLAHPNSTGFIIMILCWYYALCRGKNYHIWDAVMFFIASAFVYIVPNSETSALLIAASAMLFLLPKAVLDFHGKFSEEYKKVIFWTIVILFSVIFFVYLVALKGLGENIIPQISGTFWTRFLYGRHAIKKYGFTLFGQQLQFVGDIDVMSGTSTGNYFTLDNVYYYLPITKGIIPSLLFLIVFIFCIIRSVQKKDYMLWVVLIMLVFYGISETNVATDLCAGFYICALAKEPEKRIERIVPNNI